MFAPNASLRQRGSAYAYGLGSAVNGAIGLPNGNSCEFGACGGMPSSFQDGGGLISIESLCDAHPSLCKFLGLGLVVQATTANSPNDPVIARGPGVPVEITNLCTQMCDYQAQLCQGKAAYSSTVGLFGPFTKNAIQGFIWRTAVGTYPAQKENCGVSRALCYAKLVIGPIQ